MSSIPPQVTATSAKKTESLASQEQELGHDELEIRELSQDVHDLSSHVGVAIDEVQQALAELQGDDREQCERHLGQLLVPEDGAASFRRKVLDIRMNALAMRRKVNQDTREQLNVLASSIYSVNAELQALRDRALELGAARAEEAAAPPPAPQVPEPVAEQATKKPEDSPQRRTHTRHPIQATVTFESENNFYTGFSQDLGQGGLFIATVDVLPRGTSTELNIKMPDGTLVEVTGEVRWTREYNEQTPHVYPGMGIQFVSWPPHAQETVNAFLAQREALFYED